MIPINLHTRVIYIVCKSIAIRCTLQLEGENFIIIRQIWKSLRFITPPISNQPSTYELFNCILTVLRSRHVLINSSRTVTKRRDLIVKSPMYNKSTLEFLSFTYSHDDRTKAAILIWSAECRWRFISVLVSDMMLRSSELVSVIFLSKVQWVGIFSTVCTMDRVEMVVRRITCVY